MKQTAKTYPTEMVRDHKTGGFLIVLKPEDKKLMAKKNIIAMGADFLGHFCIIKGKNNKTKEQKERFATPQDAINAVK